VFDRTRSELVGTNRTALQAAAEEARLRGYATYVLAGNVIGEAREVGKRLAEEARAITGEGPVCLIWGGETTVTVRGHGRGGRNQELALAAALALEGSRRPIVFLSGGTDGRDGPTDAAGAWATQRTARSAREVGLLPELFLADNDAYTFFEKAGSLLRTGPTHTNVMDVQIALVKPRKSEP
jgi:hydroxypyruvate reductase